MAKKALFFQVTTRNGYGDFTKICPAQRGDDLRNILETPYVKVLDVKSLGWHPVSIFIFSK